MVIFILLVVGAGAYAWYQIDRKAREDLFGLEVDSYLQQLLGRTNALGETVAPDTGGTSMVPGTTGDRQKHAADPAGPR